MEFITLWNAQHRHYQTGQSFALVREHQSNTRCTFSSAFPKRVLDRLSHDTRHVLNYHFILYVRISFPEYAIKTKYDELNYSKENFLISKLIF